MTWSLRRTGPLLALALVGCLRVPLPPAVTGLPPDDPTAAVSAVFVGHATVLLRVGSQTVLTDPLLSDRMLWIPRVVPASLTPRQLPRIDVVLLSHPHMDHFDAPSLAALGPGPIVLLPELGMNYRDDVPQPDVRGVARWETISLEGLRITAVPARHPGGRYALDFYTNKGSTGWVVEGAGHTFFFGGDTGDQDEAFREIGRRFPSIDVAFLPIAPVRYEKMDEDSWGHMGPNQAVKALQLMGARTLVPMHFGAFRNKDEELDTPPERLREAAARAGVSDRVVILLPGEGFVIHSNGLTRIDAARTAAIRSGATDARDLPVTVPFPPHARPRPAG